MRQSEGARLQKIDFRLSVDERRAIVDAARNNGVQRGAWLRQAAAEKIAREKAAAEEQAARDEAAWALSMVIAWMM